MKSLLMQKISTLSRINCIISYLFRLDWALIAYQVHWAPMILRRIICYYQDPAFRSVKLELLLLFMSENSPLFPEHFFEFRSTLDHEHTTLNAQVRLLPIDSSLHVANTNLRLLHLIYFCRVWLISCAYDGIMETE